MIDEIYTLLLAQGWKLTEIDDMDICYWLRLNGKKRNENKKEEADKADGLYIDQFGIF